MNENHQYRHDGMYRITHWYDTVFKGKFSVTVLISILSIATVITGYLYYRNEASDIRRSRHHDLKAIAELKIDQLVTWRHERIANAEVISQRAFFIERVESWLADPANTELREDIKNDLTVPRAAYQYESIHLASSKGTLLLSVGTDLDRFGTATSANIREALRREMLTTTDFYYCEMGKTIHYDVIVPLINGKNAIVAALVFRVTPHQYLFPFIQSWPTPSATSETVIVRRDGDHVLFLNELRHRDDTALKLRIPLTEKDVPAVAAVLGHRGTWKGRDYRGEEVLAEIVAVPDTPWYMIAKVDAREMFQELQSRIAYISLLILLIIIVIIAGASSLYTYGQRNIYRRLWQSLEEFKTTLYSIGDGVITTDTQGIVQFMNPVATELTGWTESEARGKRLDSVFTIIDEETRNTVDNPVSRALAEGDTVGFAGRTLLMTRDGREIPVADSAALIIDEKGVTVGVVVVFRDQTDEREAQRAQERLIEKEMTFRALVNQAPEALFLHALDGRIVDVNEASVDRYGYTREELLQMTAGDIDPDYTVRENSGAFWEKLKERKQLRFDGRHRRKDGSVFPVRVSVSAVEIEGERRIIAMAEDITDSMRAEAALRESEERFKKLSQLTFEGILIHKNGVVVDVNESLTEMVGYSKNELVGKNIIQLCVPPEYHAAIRENIVKRSAKPYEAMGRRKDGSLFPIELESRDVTAGDEGFRVTAIRDITERKESQAALRTSEEKYRRLFERSSDPCLILDGYRFIEANDAVVAAFGYEKKSELIGKTPWDVSPAEQPDGGKSDDKARAIIDATRERGQNRFEWVHLDSAGDRVYFDVALTYLPEAGERRIYTVMRDISEQKKAEAALKESEERFRQVYEHMAVGVARVSLDFRIESANDPYCTMLGYPEDELIGKHLRDITHPDVVEENLLKQAQLAAGEIDHYRMVKQFIHKQGHIIHGILDANLARDNAGKPLCFFGSVLDITDRIRMDEQIKKDLREKEVLLRELYHRTKNNMQVISSMLRMRSRSIDDEDTQVALQEINNQIISMAMVHEKLYESDDLSSLNLKTYCADLINLIRQSYLLGSRISVSFDAVDVPVHIDTAIPIGLALNELILNAIKHAFPEDRTGEIHVELARRDEQAFTLTVSDNGSGFSDGFDVKRDGKLGLSTIIGLLERQLKGVVTFNSSQRGLECRITIQEKKRGVKSALDS